MDDVRWLLPAVRAYLALRKMGTSFLCDRPGMEGYPLGKTGSNHAKALVWTLRERL